MNKPARSWAALLTAGALTVTLTACSGDEPSVSESDDTAGATTPAGVVDDGAATDDAAETEAPDDAAATSEGPVAGEDVAVEDFIARMRSVDEETLQTMDMAMVMEMEGQEVTMDGVADFRGEDPAMDLTMAIPQMGEVRMLMVDATTFMQMPGATEGDQWIEMSAEQLGLSEEELTGQIDMTQQWDAWEEGGQRVTLVGSEEVNGEQMDHYQLEVDSAVALDATGETAAPGMPETIVYDIWLDDEDLMRKVTFDLEGVSMEMLVDNWGEDVSIEAPDPEQVQQLPTGG